MRDRHRFTRVPASLALAMLVLQSRSVCAQDLEPRRWTHLPTGLNIVGAGVGSISGDIFLDPLLRIEDASFELYTFGSSCIRTLGWLGRSRRINFRQPYGHGRWEGVVDAFSMCQLGPITNWGLANLLCR